MRRREGRRPLVALIRDPLTRGGDEQGNDWPFTSWLGLLTLIERLRSGPPAPGDEIRQREVS